jgi:nicotinamide-nucleotide amidase
MFPPDIGALLPLCAQLWNGHSPSCGDTWQHVSHPEFRSRRGFAQGVEGARLHHRYGGKLHGRIDCGFATYSNKAKNEMLGVPMALIDTHGAVSREVALAMVAGALANSPADIAVAVTGVAGPGGGTATKPVGLVHIAAARRGGGTLHDEKRFGAIGRHEIQTETVAAAFDLMTRVLD